MKKLFALLMVAGSLAVYSCGGGEHKDATATDSSAAETTMEATSVDSVAAPVDSVAAPVDSVAATPAH